MQPMAVKSGRPKPQQRDIDLHGGENKSLAGSQRVQLILKSHLVVLCLLAKGTRICQIWDLPQIPADGRYKLLGLFLRGNLSKQIVLRLGRAETQKYHGGSSWNQLRTHHSIRITNGNFPLCTLTVFPEQEDCPSQCTGISNANTGKVPGKPG